MKEALTEMRHKGAFGGDVNVLYSAVMIVTKV